MTTANQLLFMKQLLPEQFEKGFKFANADMEKICLVIIQLLANTIHITVETCIGIGY